MRFMRAGVATLAMILAACGGGEGPTGTTGGAGGGGGGVGSTSRAINVGDNFFDPSATTVPINATVTWTFSGALAHNVTFANASIGKSDNLTSGTFARTFTAAGAFSYSCTLHDGMNGTVTVQ